MKIIPSTEFIPVPQAPPYHLVFIPRFDSSEKAQKSSYRLAIQLSGIDADRNYNIEVIDFECIYKKFLSSSTLLPEEMNEAFFTKQSQAMFFKPGVVVFVVNFDLNDFFLLMTNFEELRSDLRVLLLVSKSQFDTWRLGERAQNVDCCIHQDVPNKSIMDKLLLINKGY